MSLKLAALFVTFAMPSAALRVSIPSAALRDSVSRCHESASISRRSAFQLAMATAVAAASPQLASAAAPTADKTALKLVLDTSTALKGVLESKDAFVKGLVDADSSAPQLPASIPFTTFQKLEKVAGDEFMEAAIDYAEAARAARDLVKLAKLTKETVEVSVKEKGKPRETVVKSYSETGTLGSTQEYAERAVQELLGASVALDAAIKFLP